MRLAASRLRGLVACASLLAGAAPALLTPALGEPALPTDVDTRGDIRGQVKQERAGSWVFRNRHLVASLARDASGFKTLYLYPATRPTELPSAPLAVAPILAQVVWREGGATHQGTFVPKEVRASGENSLRLKGTVQDGAASWEVEAVLWIGDSPWLNWEFQARPSTAVELVRFAPLPLQAGREGPREVLFPGILALEADEDLPGLTRQRRPLVPDPYRVTIPLMALSQAGATIALMWDNQQAWGGEGYPTALLDAAPAGQRDTGMELFLPSVPRYVREGETAAAEPMPVRAGQELKLNAKIAILPDTGYPAAAVREWAHAFRQPIMDGFPRSFAAERALAREAYTRTLWRPEAPGWVATGGDQTPPRLYPFNVLALIMDAATASEKAARPLRMQAGQAALALAEQAPLDPVLAYRRGGVDASLEAARVRIQDELRSQLASGGWSWDPATPDLAKLGPPGRIEAGTVTAKVLPILRYAALTGDSDAGGAGLRALEFMAARFRIARGGRHPDAAGPIRASRRRR